MKFLGFIIIIFIFVGAVPFSFSEDQKNTFDVEQYLKNSFNKRSIPDIETICPREIPLVAFVYLNHTITNGTLGKMCTFHYSTLFFELQADDDGYLILDIPKDVFCVDCSQYGFSVDVHSTKHTTWDDRHFVTRLYLADPVYASMFSSTAKTPEHLQITKIKSHDDFDRFKIPFLKDDIFFKLNYDHNGGDPNQIHNPQKYDTPIQKIQNATPEPELSVVSEIDRTITTDNKNACKSHLTEILKPNGDIILCVKPATADKLVLRGWFMPN